MSNKSLRYLIPSLSLLCIVLASPRSLSSLFYSVPLIRISTPCSYFYFYLIRRRMGFSLVYDCVRACVRFQPTLILDFSTSSPYLLLYSTLLYYYGTLSGHQAPMCVHFHCIHLLIFLLHGGEEGVDIYIYIYARVRSTLLSSINTKQGLSPSRCSCFAFHPLSRPPQCQAQNDVL